jgi:hypothetical protein
MRLTRAFQISRFGAMQINERLKPKNVGQLPGTISIFCTACNVNNGTRFTLPHFQNQQTPEGNHPVSYYTGPGAVHPIFIVGSRGISLLFLQPRR